MVHGGELAAGKGGLRFQSMYVSATEPLGIIRDLIQIGTCTCKLIHARYDPENRNTSVFCRKKIMA